MDLKEIEIFVKAIPSGKSLQYNGAITNRNCMRNKIKLRRNNEMKRVLGVARCGLACWLCPENITCNDCS